MITPDEVRRHFIFCQRSGRGNQAKQSIIKEQVSKLSDDEIRREIKEYGNTNNFLLDDRVTWHKESIDIDKIHNPYHNFRGISLPKKNMNSKEILEHLKNTPEAKGILTEIYSADEETLLNSMPIFARKVGDKIMGIDGWFRTISLKNKGYSKIDCFIFN